MEGNGIIKSIYLDGTRGYLDNVRLMNEIIREMKEIPELPSEKPSDVNPLLRVDYLTEGGLLTYMGNHDYPYRGFPYTEFVEKVDLIKKISRGFLSGFYHSLKGKKLRLITLLPAIWSVKNLVHTVIYTYARLIERSRIKTIRFSKCIRELHRTFSLKESSLRNQLRDLSCMILEFDNAYRYRAQDVLAELNKKALVKNTVKEVSRLLEIMISREKTPEVRDTWRLFKMFSLYLRFDKELRGIIGSVLLNLNIEEFKLTPEDKHYCVPRKDYSFGFIANSTSEDARLIKLARINFDKNQEFQQLADRFRAESEIRFKKDQEEQLRSRTLSSEEYAKITKEVQIKGEQLDREYNEKRKSIFDSYLTKDQEKLLENQRKANEDAIADYNNRLKEVDEKYAQQRLKVK